MIQLHVFVIGAKFPNWVQAERVTSWPPILNLNSSQSILTKFPHREHVTFRLELGQALINILAFVDSLNNGRSPLIPLHMSRINKQKMVLKVWKKFSEKISCLAIWCNFHVHLEAHRHSLHIFFIHREVKRSWNLLCQLNKIMKVPSRAWFVLIKGGFARVHGKQTAEWRPLDRTRPSAAKSQKKRSHLGGKNASMSIPIIENLSFDSWWVCCLIK